MNNPSPDRYVIVLNGPPGSGKDFAVSKIVPYINFNYKWLQAKHIKLAEPLKDATHKLHGIVLGPDYFEGDAKNKPTHMFSGMSPRQAYISMSEDYAKPKFGNDFFGRTAVRRMNAMTAFNCFVFSDCGFVDEIMPIIDMVGVKRLLIIEITASRNGEVLTFAGDSRDYIAAPLRMRLREERGQGQADKLNVMSLPNDFDPEIFPMLLHGAAKKFFDKF